MAISCPDCSAPMPEEAAFCPDCGRPMLSVERARGQVGALPEVVAGALAYFLVPAFVFLFVEPYSKNRFVRFHSFQCIGAWLIAIVIAAAVRIFGVAMSLLPVIGYLLISLVSIVMVLAVLITWVVLIVKALQGEMFKLPLIGTVAERQAEKVQRSV
jgi:uncharacterized membrane protein